ncbi:MAG TPA: FtsX-like permease family protein [Stellaceae bacterium]|jgi:cell division transport system permease protein|nr:FtsX-like permease family protein [Stellaceae bacterium]
MIRRRQEDIPLRRDGTARMLPWLIAPTVYLAAIAIAAMLALGGALQEWDRGLAGTMTVELPPNASSDATANSVVTLLRGTQGITSAVPLDRASEGKLLAPYLGTAVDPQELELPRLIDVRVAAGGALDIAALRAKLVSAVPGAVLDDHQQWLDRLYVLALSVEAAGLAIVAMVSAASVLTVIFTTRASLAVHRDVIELLHMMGAHDGYIARQFQREAARLGFVGGVGGLILAAVTIWGLGHAAAAVSIFGEEAALLPDLQLVAWQWGALVLLPIAAGIAAMITARLTVMRALARLA